MKKFFRKIRRVYRIIKFAIYDSNNFLLRIVEEEVHDYLKDLKDLKVRETEELEDLIFHIRAYIEIPQVLRTTVFSGSLNSKQLEDYFIQVEETRAVEREYIFELMKKLPLGFELV